MRAIETSAKLNLPLSLDCHITCTRLPQLCPVATTISAHSRKKSFFRRGNRVRILLLNPPHIAIGSRIPHEQLPPLGLLSIGGPLIDAGHEVALLDAELGPLSHETVIRRVVAHRPQVLMLGHSGSTS